MNSVGRLVRLLRLLTGNFENFERLETKMASLFGRPCLFNNGYHANIGILPAICDDKTVILADKLVHASIIDGMQLAAKHGDQNHPLSTSKISPA